MKTLSGRAYAKELDSNGMISREYLGKTDEQIADVVKTDVEFQSKTNGVEIDYAEALKAVMAIIAEQDAEQAAEAAE
jgi:TPP-dependent pyruvate/acetoin dehydrogenase alpha subunit